MDSKILNAFTSSFQGLNATNPLDAASTKVLLTFDPECIIKTYGILIFISGVFGTLAPRSAAKNYFDKKMNESNIKIAQRLSVPWLNVATHIFCLFEMNYTLNTTIAIYSATWITIFLFSLLNNEADTIGPSRLLETYFLCQSTILFYSAVYETPWFLDALKATSIITMLSMLPLMFTPQFGCKLWQVKQIDKYSPALGLMVGVNIFCLNGFHAALAWGVDPIDAFGYVVALFWGVLCNAQVSFFAKETKVLDLKKGPLVFWTAVWTCVAAAILIP